MWNGGVKTKQFLIQKKSPGKSFRAGNARNFMKSVLIKILAPVCAVMIAASLSACGEKSNSSAESSKAESSAAAETTKATEASKATETAAPTTAEADDTTDGELKTGAVDEKIIGNWEYEEGGFVYTFNANGTGIYDAFGQIMNFTYTADGAVLSITYEGSPAVELEYELDGDTLNIKDSFGNDTIYNRK